MNIHQTTTEPALLSLTEVARAIAGKRFSSREVTQSCLDRIAQWQPRLHAFMAIEGDEALGAAGGGGCGWGTGEGPCQGCAAWRAAGAQGHVLRGREGRHLRLKNPSRFCRDHNVHCAATPEGRRHDPAGLAADGGIRLWADWPQLALRRGA